MNETNFQIASKKCALFGGIFFFFWYVPVIVIVIISTFPSQWGWRFFLSLWCCVYAGFFFVVIPHLPLTGAFFFLLVIARAHVTKKSYLYAALKPLEVNANGNELPTNGNLIPKFFFHSFFFCSFNVSVCCLFYAVVFHNSLGETGNWADFVHSSDFKALCIYFVFITVFFSTLSLSLDSMLIATVASYHKTFSHYIWWCA